MHHGAEFTAIVIASLALLVGVGTRLFSAKTRFPYTIAMLLMGMVVGVVLKRFETGGAEQPWFMVVGHGADISHHLIILVFLPALLFESAYSIDVHVFKNNLGAVVVFAVPALVLSTVLSAALMVGVTSGSWAWGWPVALVFGALISATDPVAVVAILRELGVSKRLAVLIEGESLLNDGTAIVVFSVLLELLTGARSEFETLPAVVQFLKVVSGGVGIGLVLAFVFSSWIEALFNDPLSEITLTLVLAYSAMFISELFHVSGVMAVVTTGLWMSGAGRTKVSPEVSHFLHRFWETLGYIANTLIFFLVGLIIAREIEHARLADALLVVGAYVGVMVIRFALTYLFGPLANRLSDGVSRGDAAIMSWGGLRGAVSLALALVIVQNPDVPHESSRQILLVTAGVVLLTIVVNGTTMGRLLSWLGYDKPALSAHLANLSARGVVLDKVAAGVQQVSNSRDLRTCRWSDVHERIDARKRALSQQIERAERMLAEAPASERIASTWRRVLALERQDHWEAFGSGTLGTAAVKVLTREISRQVDAIARGNTTPPETRTPPHATQPSFFGRFFGGTMSHFDRLTLLYDLSRAESRSAQRVLSHVDELPGIEPELREQIRATYQRYLRLGKERIEDLRTNLPEVASAIETRLAKRIELNLEREGYEDLAHRGIVEESTAERELHDVERRMHMLRRSAERVPIPETAELVASTPMFSCLDAEALAELAELTEEMVVPVGETLFEENDRGDSLFVIARGAVHVIKHLDGSEVLVDVLGGGDIIGEMALLTGARRTATARAGTSVTLGKLTRSAFDHLMQTQPALREKVWQEFARRTFDNLARQDARLAHMGDAERRSWFAVAEHAEVPAGESRDLEAKTHMVLVSGEVQVGSERHHSPRLIALKGGEARAVEASYWVLLGEPPAPQAPTGE